MSERGAQQGRVRVVLRWLLAVLMTAAGVMHFVAPRFYLPMMPDYLPWHLELVYISGVFEVLFGLGLLHPRTRTPAGWGLIALLIAVFPANVWMATHAPLPGLDVSPLAAWLRLPFQALFMAWAWWVSRPD
jgi:uncharacterized membrane protein